MTLIRKVQLHNDGFDIYMLMYIYLYFLFVRLVRFYVFFFKYILGWFFGGVLLAFLS